MATFIIISPNYNKLYFVVIKILIDNPKKKYLVQVSSNTSRSSRYYLSESNLTLHNSRKGRNFASTDIRNAFSPITKKEIHH